MSLHPRSNSKDSNIKESELLAGIQELIQVARQRSGQLSSPDSETLRAFEALSGRFRGEPVERVVVALRTKGCLWFRGRGKACTHCGLVRDGLWSPDLDENRAFAEFSKALEAVGDRGSPILCLYVAGSFFDDLEISPESRRRIIDAIASVPTIRRLVVECRPELVKPGTIAPTVERLGAIELEVGLGFDSVDPRVRSLCLNKQTRDSQFESAARILREEGARLLTYLVLKPPFLTEKAAIDEAIATGHRAFDLGSDAVSIEPLAAQEGTLAHVLWEQGLHRSPWLWSVIEVVRSLAGRGVVRVGGVVVYPSAHRYPNNCDRCTEEVFGRLQQFNVDQDVVRLTAFDCACQSEWRSELDQPAPPLLKRIASQLATVEAKGILTRERSSDTEKPMP